MKVVILDGMENENPIENILKERFKKGSEEVSYFKLKDMELKILEEKFIWSSSNLWLSQYGFIQEPA